MVFLVVGFLVVLAQTFLLYHRTLNVGFLLDDFVHLDYPYQAFHGDPSGIIRTLTGNWSGQADGLMSFRPGISASFMVDFLLHGLSPVGYHLTNLFAFSACAFLSGLLAYQLVDGKDWHDRVFAAIFASSLFLVYPLHVESVSWIVGRVDLFCTAFYLASLCLYFRFRKLGQIPYLALSLLSFMLALSCKEMAVTLPAVIAIAEFMLPTPLCWLQRSVKIRLLFVSLFFGVLAAFSVIRTLLLKTLVGGYGSTTFKGFCHSLHNFLDAPTLKKIVFGVNEEQPFSVFFTNLANIAWSVVVVSLLIRFAQPLNRLRVFAFISIWLAVSVLPTFQIWHINPNLVGSRLFFLGSSSLCILLAVALVPMIDVGGRLKDKSERFRIGLTAAYLAGVTALTLLNITWLSALNHNLYPWIEAGKQMTVLRSKIIELAKDPNLNSLVLLDLPQDFSGAGMVGGAEFFNRMLQPPVADADYAKKVVLLGAASGAGEAIDRELLKRTYEEKKGTLWLRWSKDAKCWFEWRRPKGSPDLAVSRFRDHFSKQTVDTLSIEDPNQVRIIWTGKLGPIDPFSIDGLVLEVDGSNINAELCKKMHLVWRSQNQPKSWADYSEGPEGELLSTVDAPVKSPVTPITIGFQPLTYRSWLLNGPVIEIGIKLPKGNYRLKPLKLESVASARFMPGSPSAK